MKKKKSNGKIKKVVKHLKSDIKESKAAARKDRSLMKSLKKSNVKNRKKHAQNSKKFDKVMNEYGEGTLRSGSSHGPQVNNPKQALAIAFSEQRRTKKKRK